MRNVPGDGNCSFYSVLMQLKTLGIQLEPRAMRDRLVEYLAYTHDGSCHLRVFLADSTASSGDMEPADEEDPSFPPFPMMIPNNSFVGSDTSPLEVHCLG